MNSDAVDVLHFSVRERVRVVLDKEKLILLLLLLLRGVSNRAKWRPRFQDLKISLGYQDFYGISIYGFRNFYGIYGISIRSYLTEIIGKKYCLGFRISDSSKISARISASASKISACCGPLVLLLSIFQR